MKYICFYDTEINRRTMKMAAVNKINYICSALHQIGFDAEIVSCSTTAPYDIPATTERINDYTTVTYFKTDKATSSKLRKITSLIRRNMALFFYLMRHTQKGETVLAYHSLSTMRCLRLAKKLKGFRLLLEAEEIYNDVFVRSSRNQKAELAFLKSAEMYLFPTAVLADKVNPDGKPQAIVYGAYEVGGETSERKSDGKVHVAYTGSFDPNKGGLWTALEAALHLNEQYCLHILGTGTPDVMEKLNAFIDVHSGKDACEIRYDGLRQGKDYTDYLQTCDIGLSTQNPDASFNNTSFPSKVISYLGCDLRVVTYPIEVLTRSELASDLFFYETNSPEAIADTIRAIDCSVPYDGKSRIRRLDASFRRDLQSLLQTES
ncbi:MAG: glycosyltransferase [Clostridia bacterium]|nr:glycosyltransferase [Clostridia bacterium]